MKAEVKPPVFDHDESYENSSRLIRWFVLVLVLVTFPSTLVISAVVYTALFLMICYNALRTFWPRDKPSFMTSRLNSLVIDHIFVYILVLMSGGLASPYYPLFFLLIISVIASYGVAGFSFELAVQVVIAITMAFVNQSPQPNQPEFQAIIMLSMVIIFSLVAERAVRARDAEVSLEDQFTLRLENERKRLLALINSLTSGVLAIDADGRVYLYNAAALSLLDTNRDINGQPLAEILPLKDSGAATVDIKQLVTQSERPIHRQDLRLPATDGTDMILDFAATPVHTFGVGDESDGGYMVILSDITKQKSLEEERDEFISVTSHELRTPLAIAEANISTALLPGYAHIDDKAVDLLNQAHENIVFLGELIKDLTTLSRAERADLKYERKLIDIAELADELIRDYAPSVEAKKLAFKHDVAAGMQPVNTSELELREMIQNLITNAVKYTQTGTVTLAVVPTDGGVNVSVADTGIGISASDKPKIFSKFYRSEDYRTRATGGTGLGLYITKKLSERLGCKLTFESHLNKGTVFTLFVPYAPTEVKVQAAAEALAGK